MQILKAFKFRIYPTEEQKAELAIQFGHARFVYNASLELRNDYFFMSGQSLRYEDTANALVQFKQNNPDLDWLAEADSQVLQQSLKDLDKAFQNFFRNYKNGTLPPPGKKPRKDGMPNGYPTLKRKFDKQSIRYPQRFKVDGNKVYLPKVGWVQAVFHRRIPGTMNNCTVSKTKTGKYFISIQCEINPKKQPRPSLDSVGVDLGLKDFAILSTGEKIDNPKHLHRSQRRLKIRQRRLSRKVKGSNSRVKAKHVVATFHEKIANQRKDFQHKVSRTIVDRFGTIGLETLNVRGMVKNHHFAKAISDAGWNQFVGFVEYKAQWAGGEVVKAGQFFPSSKTCHECGAVNHDLTLSDRMWVCASCGVVHDRDTNAAKNLVPKLRVERPKVTPVDIRVQPVRNSAPETFKSFQQVPLFALEAQDF